VAQLVVQELLEPVEPPWLLELVDPLELVETVGQGMQGMACMPCMPMPCIPCMERANMSANMFIGHIIICPSICVI
jgi:hypothetical protein